MPHYKASASLVTSAAFCLFTHLHVRLVVFSLASSPASLPHASPRTSPQHLSHLPSVHPSTSSLHFRRSTPTVIHRSAANQLAHPAPRCTGLHSRSSTPSHPHPSTPSRLTLKHPLPPRHFPFCSPAAHPPSPALHRAAPRVALQGSARHPTLPHRSVSPSHPCLGCACPQASSHYLSCNCL